MPKRQAADKYANPYLDLPEAFTGTSYIFGRLALRGSVHGDQLELPGGGSLSGTISVHFQLISEPFPWHVSVLTYSKHLRQATPEYRKFATWRVFIIFAELSSIHGIK
jgi:hypothetical protein